MPELNACDQRTLLVGKAVSLFNSGKFWHCHEALEKVWLKESGDTKKALQGVILVAAAFHHQRRRNRDGMLSTLKRGFERIQQLDECYGMNVKQLREHLADVMKVVAQEDGWLKATPPKISMTSVGS